MASAWIATPCCTVATKADTSNIRRPLRRNKADHQAQAVAPLTRETVQGSRNGSKKSDAGNDTAEIDGFRVTIFERNGGWTYCISEILDEEHLADGLEDVPEFGDWFPTKAAAKKGALEELS